MRIELQAHSLKIVQMSLKKHDFLLAFCVIVSSKTYCTEPLYKLTVIIEDSDSSISTIRINNDIRSV